MTNPQLADFFWLFQIFGCLVVAISGKFLTNKMHEFEIGQQKMNGSFDFINWNYIKQNNWWVIILFTALGVESFLQGTQIWGSSIFHIDSKFLDISFVLLSSLAFAIFPSYLAIGRNYWKEYKKTKQPLDLVETITWTETASLIFVVGIFWLLSIFPNYFTTYPKVAEGFLFTLAILSVISFVLHVYILGKRCFAFFNSSAKNDPNLKVVFLLTSIYQFGIIWVLFSFVMIAFFAGLGIAN